MMLKHGKSKTKVYHAWENMGTRCTNKNYWLWKDYGGRGIRVCKRWTKFENFLEDMGEPPTPKHTLERRDNDKGYSPGNCYWATAKRQAQNRSSSWKIRFQGKIVCLKEYCEICGLNYHRVFARLKLGWSFRKAVSVI